MDQPKNVPLIFSRRTRTNKFSAEDPISSLLNLFSLRRPEGRAISLDYIHLSNRAVSFAAFREPLFDPRSLGEHEYGAALVFDAQLRKRLDDRVNILVSKELEMSASNLDTAKEEFRIIKLREAEGINTASDTIKGLRVSRNRNLISQEARIEAFQRLIVFDFASGQYLHVGSEAFFRLSEQDRELLQLNLEMMTPYWQRENELIISFRNRNVEGKLPVV